MSLPTSSVIPIAHTLFPSSFSGIGKICCQRLSADTRGSISLLLPLTSPIPAPAYQIVSAVTCLFISAPTHSSPISLRELVISSISRFALVATTSDLRKDFTAMHIWPRGFSRTCSPNFRKLRVSYDPGGWRFVVELPRNDKSTTMPRSRQLYSHWHPSLPASS